MTFLAEFRTICGDAHASPATSDDGLLGSAPHWVVRPRTTDEVAEVLLLAADRQLHTVVRGAGSKLHWGPAPYPVDLVLDTSRMTGVIDHAAADGTATVRAGTRLDALAERFVAAGQRLPLDPPGPSTVGGTVATGTSGPLRMRHGDVAELLLSATLVRGDGTVVRDAGTAVSEVPGSDIAAGFGALGVVTEATFRLHGRPPVRRWLVREVASPAEVRALTSRLLEADPAPSAIEVYSPCGPNQIGVLVEGTAEEVADRVAALAPALAADGTQTNGDGTHRNGTGRGGGEVTVSERPPPWWASYPFENGDVALRITTPPCEIFSAGYIVRDGAGGAPVRTRWSPGIAVMYAALPCDTEPARVARMIEGVRQTLIARDGSCVVLHAPPAVRQRIDMWGPLPEPDVQRRRKQRYDPYGLLAPGRFPAS